MVFDIKKGLILVAFACVIFQAYLMFHLSSFSLTGHHNKLWKSTNELTSNSNINKNEIGYDFVTLIHHSDISPFIAYGYESWMQYFANSNSRVYAICTQKAYTTLNNLMSKEQKSTKIVLVLESEFLFTLDDLKAKQNPTKPTWLYQQLLKLYAFEVLSDPNKVHPTIKPLFLVIDSDTIAIRPFKFLDDNGFPVYNIASRQSGAFKNDCDVTRALNRELVPDGSLPPAFPDYNNRQFTSITHMMMFNGKIVNEFLSYITTIHSGEPAWKVLDRIHRSVLSEWELYMAWVMSHYRESIALKQIPYANWGNITKSNLLWLQKEKDLFYVSKHDEYTERNICCVNSEWSKMGDEQGQLLCKCCPGDDECEHVIINCSVLGMDGCYESDGLMRFEF